MASHLTTELEVDGMVLHTYCCSCEDEPVLLLLHPGRRRQPVGLPYSLQRTGQRWLVLLRQRTTQRGGGRGDGDW
jgi:hypothetical protein